MTATDKEAWQALDHELAAWAEAGRRAEIWWRDDDACTPCPALDRLLDLADASGMPLALAVIPQRAVSDLAAVLAGHGPEVRVLQHGFAHIDNAAAGARKCELVHPDRRPAILEEVRQGRARLTQLFGNRVLPVMVPPWNRIDPVLAARLPKLGFAALSRYKARGSAVAAPDLMQVNCHLDILQWRPERRFLGTAGALALLVDHLAAKRRGTADTAEPSGILSHHQAHDAAAWAFLAELLDRLARDPAVRLLTAAEVFTRPPVGEDWA